MSTLDEAEKLLREIDACALERDAVDRIQDALDARDKEIDDLRLKLAEAEQRAREAEIRGLEWAATINCSFHTYPFGVDTLQKHVVGVGWVQCDSWKINAEIARLKGERETR